MSETEQDLMNAALDNLGIDQGEVTEPIPKEETEVIEEEEEALDANPPGFKTYEEWVADGGDPDDWQGKNKYSQHYDLIQNNKEVRSEIKQMNQLLKTTVEATTDMQTQAYKRGLQEAKSDLQKAVESEDVDAVMAARDKVDAITNSKPTAQTQVNPIHSDFFSNNQIVDTNSDQCNPELRAEFERIYNGRLRNDGVAPDQQLPAETIHRYMKAALTSAKSLFPDEFESPRNSRRTTITKNGKRPVAKKKAGDVVNNVKIKTKNPRDTNAFKDVYEAIKERDPKQAEAFAERMSK